MRLTAVMLCACLVATQSVTASEATFPVRSSAGEEDLTLYGVGRLSRWLITGCDIALYLPAEVDGGRALDDVAKQLRFHYYREIRADQFASGAEDTLKRAYPDGLPGAVREQVEAMHAAYRGVRPGDEYRLTYEPGEGTTLELNGRKLITVTGADFARIYFGVWLGDPSLDDRLKAGLLRRRDITGLSEEGRVGVSG